MPGGAGQEHEWQGQAETPGAAKRFLEIDVEERDDEQAEADKDRGDRDDVRNGAGQLRLVIVVRRVRGVRSLRSLDLDVVFRAGRDIVDIDRSAVVQIVHRIDAAAAAFLDRPARFMFLVRAALLAAQPLGRCRGTEVGAAIAPAGPHRGSAGTGSAKAATAWPRAAETTTARARPAKTTTARPRSAKPTAATGTGCESSRRTIFARTRLTHCQIAALKRLRIKPLDDLFGLAAILKLHERKATRTSGLAIDGHDYMRRFGNSREVGAKVSFAGPVGKVPDEQTDSQGFLVLVRRSPQGEGGSVGGSDSIPERANPG